MRSTRHWLAAGGLATGLALWPRSSFACAPIDGSCFVDGGLYNGFLFIARLLWMLNRTLLQTCFILDEIRWWAVNVAFTGGYDVLRAQVGAVLPVVVSLALTLAIVAVMLSPLSGLASPFNVRQILTWAIIGPSVLLALGPGLLALERARGEIDTVLGQAAAAASLNQSALVRPAQQVDLAPVAALYPSVVCGTELPRRSGGDPANPSHRRIDEIVAALFYADTADVHCPQQSPQTFEDRSLPAGFFAATPGYAFNGEITLLDAAERQRVLNGIHAGVTRLAVGLLPSSLAVLFYVLQLLFSLALIAMWIAFPIGMLVGFFQRSPLWLSQFIRRSAGVVQSSWVASFLIGLIFAGLRATAESGNAAMLLGAAIGAVFFTGYLLSTATQTLRNAVNTIGEMGGALSGGGTLALRGGGQALQHAGSIATAPARALGGLRDGVAAAALAATAGARAPYSIGVGLGRLRPVAQLGEVSRALRGDDPLLNGIAAGSKASFRDTVLHIGKDLRRGADTRRVYSGARDYRNRMRQSAEVK